MNDTLTKELISKYPILFGEKSWIHREGFRCGDGWYHIINDMCTELEATIRKLPLDKQETSYVCQIKNKFGMLRVYLERHTEETDIIINRYENLSANICEDCGDFSTKKSSVYIRPLCDKCYKASRKKN